MKILLIIPAFNEQESILNTINAIKKHKRIIDYIVINDGSTDNTPQILKENKINHINLIHNLGIGGAVQTGYKYAKENNYDIAIQFDGDGQHDIKYVESLVKPILNGEANMVIGSRFCEQKSDFKSTFMRRIGIRIISFFIQLSVKKKIYDTTSGFRACDKKIIEKFSMSYPTEYPEPISTVDIIKAGYTIKEIAVEMREREAGNSSIHSWKNIYYMVNVIFSIIIVSIRRYR